MMRSQIAVLALVAIIVAGVVVAKQVVESRKKAATEGAAAEKASAGAGKSQRPPVAESGTGKVLSGSELARALKSGRPTMAEFGLGTCQVCRDMAPILAQAANEYARKASIVSVDLDEHPALASYYQIKLMPTQIFFDPKGEQVERHVGALSLEQIAQKLDALGAKSRAPRAHEPPSGGRGAGPP